MKSLPGYALIRRPVERFLVVRRHWEAARPESWPTLGQPISNQFRAPPLALAFGPGTAFPKGLRGWAREPS